MESSGASGQPPADEPPKAPRATSPGGPSASTPTSVPPPKPLPTVDVTRRDLRGLRRWLIVVALWAIEAGKDAIVKAMRKQGLPIQRIMSHEVLVGLADDMRYPDVSALYAAVGEGHVSAANVVDAV